MEPWKTNLGMWKSMKTNLEARLQGWVQVVKGDSEEEVMIFR